MSSCAFYVSGTASRLRKLLAAPASELTRDTRLVVSDSLRNQDLAGVLADRGVRFICFDYAALAADRHAARKALSDLLLAEFDRAGIDHCFCFGDHLLVGELLTSYRHRIVNFHPSLLPMFPGRRAIDQAVAAGAFLLGNTAHFVDAGVDTGPIIMQAVMPATVFDGHNYDAVLDAQIPMVHQIHRWLNQGRLHVVDGRVTLSSAEDAEPAFFPPLERPAAP